MRKTEGIMEPKLFEVFEKGRRQDGVWVVPATDAEDAIQRVNSWMTENPAATDNLFNWKPGVELQATEELYIQYQHIGTRQQRSAFHMTGLTPARLQYWRERHY